MVYKLRASLRCFQLKRRPDSFSGIGASRSYFCRSERLCSRRECPAPTTAPFAALPPVAAPITAPFAAPLALGWLGCCCCGDWVCVAGGAVVGWVCAAGGAVV